MPQPELLTQVINLLNTIGIDYMITGSVVSSLYGEPRATHDVDIIVHIDSASVPLLVEAFPQPHFYVSEQAIRDAIANKSMFNLLDMRSGDKVDFWMLTNDPYDLLRFSRKQQLMVSGINMNVPQPEDVILSKLKWAKLSAGSNKQLTDALRVYEVQYNRIDKDYLLKWAESLDVDELLRDLIKDARPVE